MTLIRILKSHDGDDGVRRKGDIYDAGSTIATAKIAAGLAVALNGGEIATYNARDFATELSAATDDVATAADDEATTRDDLRDAKTARSAARRDDVEARAAERAAIRAAAIGDVAGPAGHAVAFGAASYQLGVDADDVDVDVTDAEVGADWEITVTSTGGGTPVTDSGTVAEADFTIEGLDLSGLTAGTLTASLVLTDSHNNAAAAVTDTATLQAGA